MTAHEELPKLANADFMVSACCVALATLVPVTLYQTHLIDRLPDPPFVIFASEEITSSKTAHPLGVPDGLLGLVSFGTTLALIVLAKRNGRARLLLGGKLAIDGSFAAFNASRQLVSFGRLCSWCTGTAAAAAIMVYAGRQAIAAAADTVVANIGGLER